MDQRNKEKRAVKEEVVPVSKIVEFRTIRADALSVWQRGPQGGLGGTASTEGGSHLLHAPPGACCGPDSSLTGNSKGIKLEDTTGLSVQTRATVRHKGEVPGPVQAQGLEHGKESV